MRQTVITVIVALVAVVLFSLFGKVVGSLILGGFILLIIGYIAGLIHSLYI